MNKEKVDDISDFIVKVIKRFIEHPNSNNMTYKQHFVRAMKLASRMGLGMIYLIIHAFFPFIFETRGSKIINELHEEVKETR